MESERYKEAALGGDGGPYISQDDLYSLPDPQSQDRSGIYDRTRGIPLRTLVYLNPDEV